MRRRIGEDLYQLECDLAEGQHVTVLDKHLGDPDPVHERSVARAEVAYGQPLGRIDQLGMTPRHGGIVHRQIRRDRPAQDNRLAGGDVDRVFPVGA